MKLVCPACGEFVPGKDIDLARSLALCRPCGEVVPLPPVVTEDEHGVLVVEGSALLLAQKIAQVPLYAYRPEACQLEERREGRKVQIRLREDRGSLIVFVVASLIWTSLLWYWYRFLQGTDSRALKPIWILLAGLHGLSAVYMVFLAARSQLNRTELTFAGGRFSLGHTPLWQEGAFSEPLANVRTFIHTGTKITRIPDRWFRDPYGWSIMMLTRDQRSVELELCLDHQDHARYLALRLNRAVDELRPPPPRPATRVERAADAPAHDALPSDAPDDGA